jgi:hypothetical protein
MENNSKIVNASYWWTTFSTSEYDSIQTAKENWILMIIAAWNNSTNNEITPFYPASYDLDNIISVASVWSNDVLAWYSNYWNIQVDVLAPGWEIFDYNTWEWWILSTYNYTENVFENDLSTFDWTTFWTWSDWYLYWWWVWYHTQTPLEYTWRLNYDLTFDNSFSLDWASFAKMNLNLYCDFWTNTLYDDDFNDYLDFKIIDLDTSNELLIW